MRERWSHLRPPWLGRDEPRWLVAPASLGDVVETGTLRLFVVLEFAESGPTRVEQLDVLDAVATVGTLTYNRGSIAETTLAELGKLFGRTPAVRVQHRGAEAAAEAVLDTYQRLATNVVD